MLLHDDASPNSKPRIVIAGIHSDSGKTTIATGIMGALKSLGLVVQGFKVGPDYLDPSYHACVTGRPSRNLDTWLMGERGVIETFHKATLDADVGVIEGVMGLYDGSSATSDAQSTAELAALLKCPVILVVDAHGFARSAAAEVLGFSEMAKGFAVRGVILNRTGGPEHFQICKEAVEKETSIPVVGHMPYNNQVNLPSRHLGLYSASTSEIGSKISLITKMISESVDIRSIRFIASRATQLTEVEPPAGPHGGRSSERPILAGEAKVGGEVSGEGSSRTLDLPKSSVAIGVALDESFSFYYEDNFDELRSLGAEVKFFSPIRDKKLPEVDALYIGGGYPEINADRLEENVSIKDQIHRAFDDGMPIYAECGGLMYLGRETVSLDGKRYRMAGVFDLDTQLTSHMTLGYTELESVGESPISVCGTRLFGHEFHYSNAVNISRDCKFVLRELRGKGITGSMDGCASQNALGCYGHLHFRGAKKSAKKLVQSAYEYSKT